MPDPTTTLDSSSTGAWSFSLVPVDHDPFNSQSFSLVPVDHDPFAAGSIAQPQTNPSNNGLGTPNSQYQLSPLGSPGQVVPQYDAMQALKFGQPIAARPMGALNAGRMTGVATMH